MKTCMLKVTTKERDALNNPNHLAMLCFISFFLNDGGAVNDAFYYCIVALTRNYQKILASIENAISILEGPFLQGVDQSVFTKKNYEFGEPLTAIGHVVRSLYWRSPGRLF